MQVVLPFHSNDAQDAIDLLYWMEQLGDKSTTKGILAVDAGVDWGQAVEVLAAANRVFRFVQIVTTEEPVSGWPRGANSLFWKAAEHCQRLNEPFLWLEPDCVPLARNWFERIQSEYQGGYLGHIYECNQPGLPRRLLSGVAAYPPSAFELISPFIGNQPHLAWDVSAAEAILPVAKDSHLFHHLWGDKDLLPTFRSSRGQNDASNVLTLDHLRKGAVLFHRNKDGTLQRLVAHKLGLAALTDFVVVLPVCNMDADLMLKMLDWILELGNSQSHEALLSYDQTALRGSVSRIASKASACFAKVHQTSYGVPKATRFPQTAAWQHAARVMQDMGRPWLWLEADCVPLKPNWLQALQVEYDRCGQPFCGPVVHQRGHANGTSIYPANTPQLVPRTMSTCGNAFDVEMKDEMIHLCKDIGHIFFHVWGVKDGRLDPLEGPPPSFARGSPLLSQIPRSSVVMHRCKDSSLIDRLRETR